MTYIYTIYYLNKKIKIKECFMKNKNKNNAI